MICRNFYEIEGMYETSHGGKGEIKNVLLYDPRDFDTDLRFIMYTELQPGQSIGYHPHGQNEEIYVVLTGTGRAKVNDEEFPVRAGDVLLNKPGWSHGLENDSEGAITLLIFEAQLA